MRYLHVTYRYGILTTLTKLYMLKDMQNPKIAIGGRVDPRAVCLVAVWLEENGYHVDNKSELVHHTFTAFSRFLKQMNPDLLSNIGDNHTVLAALTRLGLEWPGDRAQKDWMRALQVDTLKDLTPEQLEEVGAFAQQLKKQNETLPDEPEDNDPFGLKEELDKVDQELAGGSDEEQS